MKIRLLVIGKTAAVYLQEGIGLYRKRLVHYADFTLEVVPDVKATGSTSAAKLAAMESEAFLKRITPRDKVVLLDEAGQSLTSEGFARQLEKWMSGGEKSLVFIIGGAYGFGDELRSRANARMSLSPMTFSHQMVRLIFTEQLYRAFTILKGEPYHHK